MPMLAPPETPALPARPRPGATVASRQQALHASLALLGAAILALLLAAPARAEMSEIDQWTHGNWSLHLLEADDHGWRWCELRTGGDGQGMLSITVGDRGQDPAFTYTPDLSRGQPQPLEPEDRVTLMLDGHDSPLARRMEIEEGHDQWGDFVVDASVAWEDVSVAVRDLRSANTLMVGRMERGGPLVLDTFRISGFTAAWLKASEWCRFDPVRGFRTL